MVSHFNIYLALLCFLKGYNPLLLKTQSRHQNKGMPPAEAHEGRHFWFNSAGIPTNDLMNKKYKKKQNNLGPINSTLRQLSDASDVLFCGALCRRKNRAEDGGAEEDYQCWIQDTCVPPLSDRAQEDDACGRGQGHLCIQTVHTQLKF